MHFFCRGSYPYRGGGSSLYQGNFGACIDHDARGYRPVLLYCRTDVPLGTSIAGIHCLDENDLRWQWQLREF